MKSILLLTSAPLLAVLTVTPTAVPQGIVRLPSFGVYDPEMHCPREKQLRFIHVFISWANYVPGDLFASSRLSRRAASDHLSPLSHGPIKQSARLRRLCWAMSRRASMTREFKPLLRKSRPLGVLSSSTGVTRWRM